MREAERAHAYVVIALRDGHRAPFPLVDTADRLHLSVTPVRDALMRLTGERLVEAHPRGGFSPARLTPVAIAGLAQCHMAICALALRSRMLLASPARPTPPEPGARYQARAMTLCAAIAAHQRNGVIADQLLLLSERLAPVFASEAHVDPAFQINLELAHDDWRGRRLHALRRRVAELARLRLRNAAAIAAQLEAT